jgi:hypothetical protein
MEVFFTAADYYALPRRLANFRYCAQNLCRSAWEMMPDIELIVLRGGGREWQRNRRIQAEGLAAGEVYILADDDMLPIGDGWAKADPGAFAIASAYPLPATINRWTPLNYQPLEGEHVSVGGIRVCKRGAMQEWPEMDVETPGYDAIQCEWLRHKGHRVGYHPKLKAVHLGEGRDRSAIWAI